MKYTYVEITKKNGDVIDYQLLEPLQVEDSEHLDRMIGGTWIAITTTRGLQIIKLEDISHIRLYNYEKEPKCPF